MGVKSQSRLRWGYVFLAVWAVIFAGGLLLVPSLSMTLLIPESLFNAAILVVVVYGLAGLARPGLASKAFGVFLILLIIGLAYQNFPTVTHLNADSAKDVFTTEQSLILSAYGYAHSYVQQLEPASTPTSQGLTVPTISGTATSSSGVLELAQGWPSDPAFVDGRANVTYPSDYSSLAGYALSLINQDRDTIGVLPLSLGTIQSGQQHADSMLYFNYFSHTDNQGYTVQQRFTMMGGGTVLLGENQALDYCTYSPANATAVYPTSCNLQTVENAIANSEWAMMYNDAVCCANGHRTNILEIAYTTVSIGIAFADNSTAVYLVQDFYGPCPTGYSCQ